MIIEMVGHASAILRTRDAAIWCDPWLSGKVFNNGWGLSPPPEFSESQLAYITHIWISHEHPDHLHFPTLKTLPSEFKSKCEIIFQKNNSQKVFDALRKLGFSKFRSVRHFTETRLTDKLTLTVYQERHLDSALILRTPTETVINLNDAELSVDECKVLATKFGKFDICLNQFSIAGFDGIKTSLEADRSSVVTKMLSQHKALKVDVTIPFASFMYFCKPDNYFLNDFVNKVTDVKAEFTKNNLRCHLLFPGSALALNPSDQLPDDTAKFERFYTTRTLVADDLEPPIPLAEIGTAFATKVRHWRSRYPRFLIKKMGSLEIRIEDLNRFITLDFEHGKITESTGTNVFMTVNSQPLYFAFSQPFGVQTLGVSGRYKLEFLDHRWKVVRVVSSLDNAEIYLTPEQLLSTKLMRWVWSRRTNLQENIIQQIRRFH
jgi:UDP-MurNAc hydroxylase